MQCQPRLQVGEDRTCTTQCPTSQSQTVPLALIQLAVKTALQRCAWLTHPSSRELFVVNHWKDSSSWWCGRGSCYGSRLSLKYLSNSRSKKGVDSRTIRPWRSSSATATFCSWWRPSWSKRPTINLLSCYVNCSDTSEIVPVLSHFCLSLLVLVLVFCWDVRESHAWECMLNVSKLVEWNWNRLYCIYTLMPVGVNCSLNKAAVGCRNVWLFSVLASATDWLSWPGLLQCHIKWVGRHGIPFFAAGKWLMLTCIGCGLLAICQETYPLFLVIFHRLVLSCT